MAEDKLFNYYERQDILPTFANFKSSAELAAYAGARRELFANKLMLPTRLFRDAEVLEFGPDMFSVTRFFSPSGISSIDLKTRMRLPIETRMVDVL